MASQHPDQVAIVVAKPTSGNTPGRYISLSYAQLEKETNRYASSLLKSGIGSGMRVLLMVKPGVEFIGLTFALFKIGAIPVLIDPGMGVKQMLNCVRQVKPQVLIGIPLAQMLRVLSPTSFASIKHVVTVGRRWFWGGQTLRFLRSRGSESFAPLDTKPESPAAILFTSGSTGPPKGVLYEHRMFAAQVQAIRAQYGIKPGEIELATFPLFALFSPALGMTCVLPDMDFTQPASANPQKIIQAIKDQSVTSCFGSPALWNAVSTYGVAQGLKLPTVRRVLIAGAPVQWQIVERLKRMLEPMAEIHTPYGATESLPISSISGQEILGPGLNQTRQGAGICVGKPLPHITLNIVHISDNPIGNWSDDLLLPDGELGEIVVQGPVVTREYWNLPGPTALAKIPEGDKIWHRMGDIGYIDDQGRLWFCGRKSHRVQTDKATLFSVRCEAVFNEHPAVFRSALVGLGEPGQQEPVIIIEPSSGGFPESATKKEFTEELLDLGRRNPMTKGINKIMFHHSFPVDVRHNAKINRQALAEWAKEQLP